MQSSAANLAQQDFVALMGMHTLGFMGDGKKGPGSRWTGNPYVFDNAYYKELLLGEKSRFYQSEADRRLVANAELRNWVEMYAQDEARWMEDYARAHVAASEAGCDTLMSECDPENSFVDGGYVEPSRIKSFINWFR